MLFKRFAKLERYLKFENRQKTMKVKDLMTRDVLTCAADDPIVNVARKMIEQDRGLLVVIEDNLSKKPIGVLSDRDLINRVLIKKLDPQKTTADQIATKKMISIDPNAALVDATAIMKKSKVKRVVVLDDMGNLVGLLSQSDIIKQFLAIKDQLADLSAGL